MFARQAVAHAPVQTEPGSPGVPMKLAGQIFHPGGQTANPPLSIAFAGIDSGVQRGCLWITRLRG